MNKVKKMEIQNAPVFDLSKLEFLDKLGEGTTTTYLHLGAFGKVRLAKKLKDCDTSTDSEESSPDEIKVNKVLNPEQPTTDHLCAIKILSKHQIIKAKQVDHVFNEMLLQSTLNHPFIVL